jgi:hypothetical protein
LLRDILDSVENIDNGRTWFNTDGLEANGRISYHDGLDTAMESFQYVQTQALIDLELVMLAEKSFIVQELQYCDSSDTHAPSSLEKAIKSFDDALRSLEAVNDSAGYKVAEKTYPTTGNFRYKGLPRDALHTACIAHRTRITNILRSPGINMTEKNLLKQRAANMTTAQNVYLDKQKAALTP